MTKTWQSASQESQRSGFSGSYTNQYRNGGPVDTASFTSSMRRFDTSILERETIEPQSKHTRYKLEVDGGETRWVIYRRYRDFVLLNKKLRKLFPNFVLSLPPKRLILNNFNKDFIRKRQEGLEEYVRSILNHAEMSKSCPVLQFFRLDNPPQPNECLEACQRYCDELEHRVIDLKLKCRDLEDEINSLNNDLENSQYTQEEAKGFAVHLQTQFSSQGTELQELNQQIATAQCNELRAREELDKLREEIRAECEHVRAARDIEKQKQESLLKKQQENFQKKSEEVNKHITDLVESFSKLPNLNVIYGGRSIEVKTGDEMVQQTYDLRQAIETLRHQQENFCKEIIEMHNKETQELKAELARSDFITKTRTQEAETLRVEMKEMQLKYTHDIITRDNFIGDLQQQLQEARGNNNSTEQVSKWSLFTSMATLVMGVGQWENFLYILSMKTFKGMSFTKKIIKFGLPCIQKTVIKPEHQIVSITPIFFSQKYFYSLVLGVKLNMAICHYTMEELNLMIPQNLYHRIRANGIVMENWPSWVSRELVSYPNP